MQLFAHLFEDLLLFVYHCFDRVVIHGYLSGLCRPEQAVYFFRDVGGERVISKEVLSRRTQQYQAWVEAYARNHQITIEWAEKGVRKEDYLRPELRHMERKNQHGVYFILKSMEQGNTFRSSVPKYPTPDPNYRILAKQRSRFPFACACSVFTRIGRRTHLLFSYILIRSLDAVCAVSILKM